MTAVTAEICQACTPMLTREFLEEVSSINEGKQGQAGTSSSSATAGMKHIGIFIEDLAKFNSSTMIANLPIIMKQLDSDAHQVRSSLLQALAHLVILLDKSLKGDTEAVNAVSKADEEEVIDMTTWPRCCRVAHVRTQQRTPEQRRVRWRHELDLWGSQRHRGPLRQAMLHLQRRL